MDWINLAQKRDQWQAFVNTVINIWVQRNIKLSDYLTIYYPLKDSPP
jgi:hypothetical protein